jgi:hypothetical protein
MKPRSSPNSLSSFLKTPLKIILLRRKSLNRGKLRLHQLPNRDIASQRLRRTLTISSVLPKPTSHISTINWDTPPSSLPLAGFKLHRPTKPSEFYSLPKLPTSPARSLRVPSDTCPCLDQKGGLASYGRYCEFSGHGVAQRISKCL